MKHRMDRHTNDAATTPCEVSWTHQFLLATSNGNIISRILATLLLRRSSYEHLSPSVSSSVLIPLGSFPSQ